MRVASVFFEEPTKEHYLMEISRSLGLAHTSVKKYLKQLKKFHILSEKTDKRGKRSYPLYTANTENEQYRRIKKLYNVHALQKSGLLEEIRDVCMPQSIVVFGSYTKGEDTEESDIDLFVESEEKKLDLKRYEKLLHRKIEVHFHQNFTSYPSELKNSIINGVVLYGFLQAI